MSDSQETARGAPTDSGLGVPPYRPAPAFASAPAFSSAKESPPMARSPFSPSAPPASPVAPPAGPQVGPSGAMGGIPPIPGPRPGIGPIRPAPRDGAERRTLVVGRGISVQGTVQDAERLVVEGTVEASMIHATELAIAHGGMFKGEIEVEDAEIAGTMNGTLTARGNLVLRASGKLLGTARYRRLQVEEGGKISGQLEMLNEDTRPPELPLAAETD